MRNTISKICLNGTYAPDERSSIPIHVDEFIVDPNQWKSLGNVVSFSVENNTLTLNLDEVKVLKLYFFSKPVIRIQFNFVGDYSADNSYAIIHDFGKGIPVTVDIRRDPYYWVYKSGLNNDPEAFIRLSDGALAVGQEGYGNYQRIYAVYPDLTNPDIRRWWGRLYTELIDVADFTGGESTGILEGCHAQTIRGHRN